MTQTADRNRRFVLASRPEGAPTPDNFRLETGEVPDAGRGRGAAAHGVPVAGSRTCAAA